MNCWLDPQQPHSLKFRVCSEDWVFFFCEDGRCEMSQSYCVPTFCYTVSRVQLWDTHGPECVYSVMVERCYRVQTVDSASSHFYLMQCVVDS